MIDDVSILFPKTESGIEDGADQLNKSDRGYTPYEVSSIENAGRLRAGACLDGRGGTLTFRDDPV
jgi:hypothetical protein